MGRIDLQAAQPVPKPQKPAKRGALGPFIKQKLDKPVDILFVGRRHLIGEHVTDCVRTRLRCSDAEDPAAPLRPKDEVAYTMTIAS